jgi:hypothetical protein
MNVPDLDFVVVLQPHTGAGRKWLAERMLPENDMFSGVVVRSIGCAAVLGDEAVSAGLWISGLVKAIRDGDFKHFPDLNFVVVLQSHTVAGRKWLAEQTLPKNGMFSGVVVRSIDCAKILGDEAMRAGLQISGLVEVYTFEEAKH